MTETVQSLHDFAVTPFGATVLIVVALIALALIAVPLWRSLKYLFKAFLWVLLILLVLALAAGAVWWWMERESPDPARRETLRREAADLMRQGTNRVGAMFEEEGETHDGE
jgi:hypothetical protein